MAAEPKNNIEKIMRYAETQICGFRLSDAILALQGEVAEKSISPILSELVTKAKKLYRENGNYYLPKYAPPGLTEHVASAKAVAEKNILKSHEIEILNIFGESILKLSDLLAKMPADTNYQTLHARINAMCNKGLLKKLDRGSYQATKKETATHVTEVVTKENKSPYEAQIEVQFEACNEKLVALRKKKEQLLEELRLNDVQLEKTEKAHSALSNIINGMNDLKNLNISSLN
jgi:intracellular sulfur oxidation DsrE/DsrF family protein